MIRRLKILFCMASFIFLLSCGIIYGYRFLTLYLDNKKTLNIEKNSLVKVIKSKNEENENFKEVNNSKYFINNSDNNYLLYSNILWRIIKVNEDNSIVAISDESLTSLAYGQDLNFDNSYIKKWLNKNEALESGILQNNLNKVDEYLVKIDSCLDSVDKLDNSECESIDNDNYFSLLSTKDLANIGKQSYLINGEFFYLNNTNSENKVWYVTDEGNLTLSNGTDIIGVRPVIKIKANVDYVSGDGSLENPYKIEKDSSLFGSYVKLDNDIWRIYQVNEDNIKLVLNDYLKVNGSYLSYKYSNNSSYHNDTVRGSIAYYLNNDYFNTLSYKDKLQECTWSNGYYGKSNNYDYKSSLETSINSKIALLSIGDIKLNNNLENYFTMTGTVLKGSLLYTNLANQKVYTKSIQAELNVVPTICFDKNLLTKGNGSIDSPFEME